MKIREEKGITLVTLVVAVSILILLSSMLIYNAKDSIKMRNLKMMQNDIEILDDKIDAYYIKYGTLPISILYSGEINFESQANDDDKYYVIDLSALEGITLNYGLDYERITSEEDSKNYTNVYIINEQSHHIYYPKGIEFDGEIYYTTVDQDDEISIIEVKNDIWTQDYKDGEGNIDITNGKTTVQVGDYINYSPIDKVEATTVKSYDTETGYTTTTGYQEFSSNYTGKWKILGVNNDGQIMIVPETVIKTTSDEYYYLQGQDGYVNAADELDKISAIFGNGYGATEARSIRVEDINKLTGYNPKNVGKYDPEQVGSGTVYGIGDLDEYGKNVTYYWDGTDYPYYVYTPSDKITKSGNLTGFYTTFNWFDTSTKTWKSSTKSTAATLDSMDEIITLECNYYWYYLNSLSISNSEGNGLISGSKAYTTLYINNDNYYWLGSQYINSYSYSTHFGVRRITSGYLGANVLYNSRNDSFDHCCGIRPIVLLRTDIELTGNSEEGWTIVKE